MKITPRHKEALRMTLEPLISIAAAAVVILVILGIFGLVFAIFGIVGSLVFLLVFITVLALSLKYIENYWKIP